MTVLAGINVAYDMLLLRCKWKHKKICDNSLYSFPRTFIDKRQVKFIQLLLHTRVKFCLAASGFKVSKEDVLGLSRKDGSAAETLT